MSEKNIYLIDTNVIIRFLTRDDERLYREAERIMARIENNEMKAMLLESVLAECVYVLKGVYGVERPLIASLLKKILLLRGIRMPNKGIYLDALDYFETHNLDFVDCLLHAFCEFHGSEVLSFDKKLLRLSRTKGNGS